MRRSNTVLVQDKSLEEILEELPCVHDHASMDPLWRVQGQSFLECFCGGAVVTLALIWAQVLVMRPWDVEANGMFDVLSFGHSICAFICAKRLAMAHFGTPCRSFTWARQPQLRSAAWIMGLPSLSEEQRRLVEDGNRLISWTIRCCWLLRSVSALFSVENPFPSWIWVFPATLELLSCNDTILTLVTFQAYGSGWYKLTGVMHNTSTLHRLDLLEPAEKAEVVLRGQLEYDGKLEFATALACEYPVSFGQGYATLAAEAMAE